MHNSFARMARIWTCPTKPGFAAAFVNANGFAAQNRTGQPQHKRPIGIFVYSSVANFLPDDGIASLSGNLRPAAVN